MFERGDEESAEFAVFAPKFFKVILLQKAGEKRLREVFRVLARMAVAADISVKRIPISAPQSLQRHIGAGSGAAAGGEHERPARRREKIAGRGGGVGGIARRQNLIILEVTMI